MITSSANSKVKQVVQWQTKGKERRRDGIFLVEGFKMYQEAPEDWIQEVYVSEEALEKISGKRMCSGMEETLGQGKYPDIEEKLGQKEYPDVEAKLGRTGYEAVSAEVFRKMSDTITPQGILCVLKRPEYTLEHLLEVSRPLLLVLEGLQDPGNLGTIIRTGEGAGITGIIMSDGTVDIYHPKTIRATMGSIYRVPFVCGQNLAEVIDRLRERDIHTYAAHLDGRRYYDSFSFREGTAFLIGNESAGLGKTLAEKADHYLKIPMEGQVESLNAAIAASLLIYEAHRQRNAAGD